MTSGSATHPPKRPAMKMTWSSLGFIHWPVDVDLMRTLVPEQLEIDAFDGRAWIGLVPFTMPRVRPWFGPVPTMRRFHECNVRTYVRCGEERGVWFHSLDATSWLAVTGARVRWRLNYRMAEIDLRVDDEQSRIDYHLRRTDHRKRAHLDQPGARLDVDNPGVDCAWTVGDALPQSKPGDFEHFLTERYALFALDRRGGVRIGRIHHNPWPLRQATLERLDDASLVTAAGVPNEVISDVDPHVMAADAIDVDAWALEPATRSE